MRNIYAWGEFELLKCSYLKTSYSKSGNKIHIKQWTLNKWNLCFSRKVKPNLKCSMTLTIFWSYFSYSKVSIADSQEIEFLRTQRKVIFFLFEDSYLCSQSFFFLNIIIIYKQTKKKKLKVLVAQLCPILWSHGLQPSRLLCPWNSPAKNTGVGSLPFSRALNSRDWTWVSCTATDSLPSEPQAKAIYTYSWFYLDTSYNH